jgi:hypothetical protein
VDLSAINQRQVTGQPLPMKNIQKEMRRNGLSVNFGICSTALFAEPLSIFPSLTLTNKLPVAS